MEGRYMSHKSPFNNNWDGFLIPAEFACKSGLSGGAGISVSVGRHTYTDTHKQGWQAPRSEAQTIWGSKRGACRPVRACATDFSLASSRALSPQQLASSRHEALRTSLWTCVGGWGTTMHARALLVSCKKAAVESIPVGMPPRGLASLEVSIPLKAPIESMPNGTPSRGLASFDLCMAHKFAVRFPCAWMPAQMPLWHYCGSCGETCYYNICCI
eukprot:scaffold113954_cov19-Tisochrysis_lutea.AAC.2